MTVDETFLDPDKFQKYISQKLKNMNQPMSVTNAPLPAPKRVLSIDIKEPFPLCLFPIDNFMEYDELERPNIRELKFKSPEIIEKPEEHLSVFPVNGVLSVWTPIEEGLEYQRHEDDLLTEEFLKHLTKPDRFSISLKDVQFCGATGRKSGRFKDIHTGQSIRPFFCLNSICVATNSVMKFANNLPNQRMIGCYIPFTLFCSTNVNISYLRDERGGRELAELMMREIMKLIRWSFADTFHTLVPASLHTWSEITGCENFFTKEIVLPMSVPMVADKAVWDTPAKECLNKWIECNQTKRIHAGFPKHKIKTPLTMEPHSRGMSPHILKWGQQS